MAGPKKKIYKSYDIKLIPDSTKIKAKGIYNFEDLYIELYYWFTHFGYIWKEVEYRQIAFGGGAYRIEPIWIAEKNLDDYTKVQIKIVLGGDISDIDVNLDSGTKVKRQKCTLEFKIGLKLIRNVNQFEASPLSDIMRKLYEGLNRERLKKQESDMFSEGMKLITEMKAFLLYYPH